MILPDIISKEPLGPFVRRGDDVWMAVVRWSLFAMLEAEERGITTANVDEQLKSTDALVQRFLGVKPGNGKALQLDEKWAYNIVKQVGNYGESYERNVGMGSPLKLRARPQRAVDQGRADVSAAAALSWRPLDRGPLNASIVEAFDILPPQLQTAARYMLDRPDDVALLSMREQARRAGVPPATMTRLAKRLGLEGYDQVRELYAGAGAGRHVGLRRQGGRPGRGAEAARRAGAGGRDGAACCRARSRPWPSPRRSNAWPMRPAACTMRGASIAWACAPATPRPGTSTTCCRS